MCARTCRATSSGASSATFAANLGTQSDMSFAGSATCAAKLVMYSAACMQVPVTSMQIQVTSMLGLNKKENQEGLEMEIISMDGNKIVYGESKRTQLS